MDLALYFIRQTGIPGSVLFDRANPLIVLKSTADGVRSVYAWSVPNVPRPSDATLAALVAAPEPFNPALLLAYASNKQNALLAGTWSFDVHQGVSGATPKVVTTTLDAGGSLSMLKVAAWASLNANVSGAELPYSNVDSTSTTLSVAEAVSLVTQAGVVDAETYATYCALSAGILVAPPTITTNDQIDAAAWPTPSA